MAVRPKNSSDVVKCFIMSRFKSGLRDRIASLAILIVPWFRMKQAAVFLLKNGPAVHFMYIGSSDFLHSKMTRVFQNLF